MLVIVYLLYAMRILNNDS